MHKAGVCQGDMRWPAYMHVTVSPMSSTVPCWWLVVSARGRGGCVQAGGDHLNDGVRRLLSEAGLQDAAIKALRAHAAGDERALTAVCFAIAMILRGGEKWRESVKWAAARNALLSSITKAERVRAPACTPAQVLHSFAAMRW